MMPYLKFSNTILCHLYNYTSDLDLVEITKVFLYEEIVWYLDLVNANAKKHLQVKSICCVIFMNINSIIKYNC